MKVILLEDVKNVGHAGDIVDVADGYARNVLFPEGRAAAATAGRVKAAAAPQSLAAKRAERQLARLQELANRIDGTTVSVGAPVGPQGILHGAVTAADVAAAIEHALGITLPRHVVRLPEPLTKPGEQKVTLEFSHGLEAEVTVVVETARPGTA